MEISENREKMKSQNPHQNEGVAGAEILSAVA